MSILKVGVVSDLHSDLWHNLDLRYVGGAVQERLKEADVILLAGDIGSSTQALGVANHLFPDRPVCLVAGNHEFYDEIFGDVLTEMEAAAKVLPNLHFLNRTAYIGDRLRVLGVTLWTDFNLYGDAPLAIICLQGMYDFKRIKKDKKTYITPQDVIEWHNQDREWLLAELDKPFDGATILMTHHAPVSFAIDSKFDRDSLTPCFASRMEELLVRDDLNLVVWGHTHFGIDKTIDNTRFVSSPVGYANVRIKDRVHSIRTETNEFGMIVELEV